ncbi:MULTISPECIES: hypothetical protein [Gracilibacillus]|uniref:hypothetical protein n=1 Tax=Gracilibacillus TaxID=74385 RepID=UPI000B11E8F8|nr:MULTISPECIES: hypothetical protein [Gracilibacillus]
MYHPNYQYQQQGNMHAAMDNQPNRNQGNGAQQVLATVEPVVRHGLNEAQQLGVPHAMTEAVAIAYLMGQGQDFQSAWSTVESWWRPQFPSQPNTFY